MYSYLLFLWPELTEEIAAGDGPLVAGAAARLELDREVLVERLRTLLASSSTAESFACEASWLFSR